MKYLANYLDDFRGVCNFAVRNAPAVARKLKAENGQDERVANCNTIFVP